MNEMILSARRIYALVFRYITLLLGSMPRLFESLYWPIINTSLLGFMNYYLLKQRGIAEINFHSILGATLLLEFFLRCQLSFILIFVEEIYSRNLGQLYTSPMRAGEQLASYVIIMLIRMLALVPAIWLCSVLFGYNLLSLGEWLAPFILNMLLLGVAFGFLLISLLLRFGQSAEWFGWMFSWAFIPFIGVYYPIDILPAPMQIIGHALPISHVFESLRTIAAGGAVDGHVMLTATLTNLFYLAIAICIFFATLRGARKRGNLLNLNE